MRMERDSSESRRSAGPSMPNDRDETETELGQPTDRGTHPDSLAARRRSHPREDDDVLDTSHAASVPTVSVSPDERGQRK